MNLSDNYERFRNNLENKKIYPYLWLGLVIPFILLYFLYPLFFSFGISLTDWRGIKPISTAEFVGLTNYVLVFKDKVFWLALKNTAIFVVLTMIGRNFFGLVSALVLFYSRVKGSKAWRAILFLPGIISLVVISLIWKLILDQDGLLNKILEAVGLGFLKTIWLGNATTPIFMAVLVFVWTYTGYTMVIYYAGLQNIPDELVDASKIDGANWFQTITKIIIPLLKPVITINLVLAIITGFKIFDVVFVLTHGGPANYSQVMTTYIYWHAFEYYGSRAGGMSYASALAFILTIIIFIFSYLRIRFAKEE